MELLGCPETSVINYQSTLRDISEERRYLNRGGSLKSGILGNDFIHKFLGLFRCMAERQAICYVLTKYSRVDYVLTLLLAGSQTFPSFVIF